VRVFDDIILNLKNDYNSIKPVIEKRISDFENIWKNGSEEEIFSELVFCIFTPQSKARTCWAAVNLLKEKKFLYSGKYEEISELINNVRFRNNKAKYLVRARELFIYNGRINIRKKIAELIIKGEERAWLVKNVKGIGYKEAGHFLRNIGANFNYAILDRHILKNLKKNGVIEDIPKTLTKKHYLDIEKKMQVFSSKINIPLSHLDLFFWYNEAGEIFK